MSKSIRIIFFLSLAVNLLLVGAIGGRVLHGFKHDYRGFTERHYKFKTRHDMHKDLSAILPGDKVEMFEESIKHNFRKRKDEFPAIEAAHQKIEDIMTAEIFDPEAFRLQMEELDSLQAKTFWGIGESLLELLPQLTWEERISFVEHMKKNKPRSIMMSHSRMERKQYKDCMPREYEGTKR